MIGNATPQKLTDTVKYLRLILWGAPGCGKTVLAFTAPKPILCLQWDVEGAASVTDTDGVHLLDLSGEAPAVTAAFKDPGSKELRDVEKFVQEQSISTVIFDSCTTFGNKALLHAVSIGPKFAKGREEVTAENPGFTGYGIKNMLVNRAIMNLLAIATRTKTHLIVVAHEDMPDRDKDGHIYQQTLMLGSSLAFQIPVDFSEVWHMSDRQGKRTICIRAKGVVKPMKTRMFDSKNVLEFAWNYDQRTRTGTTLSGLYDQWVAAKFGKISPPSGV